MRKYLASAVVVALALFPPVVHASVLSDASLIPDGEYQVVVEKVIDSKHLLVKMENGLEARIPAAGTVTFSAANAGVARVFIYKGTIITYRRG